MVKTGLSWIVTFIEMFLRVLGEYLVKNRSHARNQSNRPLKYLLMTKVFKFVLSHSSKYLNIYDHRSADNFLYSRKSSNPLQREFWGGGTTVKSGEADRNPDNCHWNDIARSCIQLTQNQSHQVLSFFICPWMCNITSDLQGSVSGGSGGQWTERSPSHAQQNVQAVLNWKDRTPFVPLESGTPVICPSLVFW